MYKILIVDDERMIREGIQSVLDWDSLDIDEVFLAESGRQALECLKQHPIDILLTDICMTEMSGLTLTQQCIDSYPNLKVIVLTGYDSFDYARRALQLKVQDFLLKPVDESVLTESIAKQIHEIKKEALEVKKKKESRRALGISDQNQVTAYVRNLLAQRDVSECLDFLQNNYPKVVNQQIVVALILIPVFHEGDNKHASLQKLLNLCMKSVDLQGKGITLLGEDEKNLVLILYSNECDLKEEKIVKEVARNVGQECGSQMKYSLGNRVKGIGEIAKSYYEAVALIESEKEKIGELIRNSCESDNQLFRDVFEEMKNALCTNLDNMNYIMRVMDAFEMAVQSYNLADKYVRQCCFDLASVVYFSYIAQGNSKKEQGLEVFVDTIHSAKVAETCAITRQFMTNLLGKDEDSHEIIDCAKVFVNQHLSEPLSVSLIANNLHLSPNYFSRLFKRVVKEGCNEYIVRKRMERARELLVTTNINTGKIASMVGYVDSNYFSIAFKKYYGVAPSLFRKKDMK